LTHSSIISHLYTNFSYYRKLWEQKWEETEELGAFVFLPGKDLEWEWWAIPEIRQYIQEGGLDDREMLAPLDEFEIGEEFLALVIEYVDGPENQEAHFHRVNKAGLN
jgi:hypothetical protein